MKEPKLYNTQPIVTRKKATKVTGLYIKLATGSDAVYDLNKITKKLPVRKLQQD